MILLLAACGAPAPLPVDGQLAPCPSTPNCVIEDFPYAEVDEVADRLGRLSGAREVVVDGNHVRVSVRTRSFLFVDDVDAIVDEEGGVVHVRSASRIGYGDFGANRQRIRELRAIW